MHYYYNFDYGWCCLDYLRAVYERVLLVIRRDLETYMGVFTGFGA